MAASLPAAGMNLAKKSCYGYAKGSEWLLHEAFCLYSDRDIWNPYEKHHSTVKDACELAEKLGVKNLLLYHTEDRRIQERKRLYTEEGSKYFSGNIYVPDVLQGFRLRRTWFSLTRWKKHLMRDTDHAKDA